MSDHQCSEELNLLNGFTLRMWNFVSSSWFERLRISDRKFVNHTTEMILWSMILTMHFRFCLYNKTKIKLQIGEQNFEPSNEKCILVYMPHESLSSCSSPCHTIIVQGEPCPKLRAIYRRRGELFTSSAHYLGRGQWTTCCSFSSAFYKSNDRK